ncbi:hypothetical protein D1831_12465 [Lactiplantibacillus garii]|uniref:Uncharacterized protein n=1 Tax=Lactiplantibacillus garii TaxID=2306423 RepID=A0A426D489_9LACO|nr:hypothetical protein [Lactiplantibacillus garii]RRK09483.1 hypothetical protein D1831_12465 [Lactiplantibacillus garii]
MHEFLTARLTVETSAADGKRHRQHLQACIALTNDQMLQFQQIIAPLLAEPIDAIKISDVDEFTV